MQMRIPRFTLAHFGVLLPQSAHCSLPGIAYSSFRRDILVGLLEGWEEIFSKLNKKLRFVVGVKFV